MCYKRERQMSRPRYVKYRLMILRDMRIRPPAQNKIDKMLDPTAMSDAEVDAVFRGCIERAYNLFTRKEAPKYVRS